MEFATDLTVIWAFIIALAVFAYVVMDGFDLGIGMLFAFYKDRKDRDLLMNSVAPVWDGNETWLVLGGGGLLAAFPLAYSIILTALYAPIIAMLLGLVFRGVAFEFRWRTERGRWLWDLAFMGGSAVAAFCQGVILGALIQGIDVEGRAYAGGWWDWLSLFSVATGVAVMFGYMLLGATWLIMKSSGAMGERARRQAWTFALITLGFIILVSLANLYLDPAAFDRWLSWPAIVFTAPVPVATGLLIVALFYSLHVHLHDYRPFLLALGIFALCFLGLGISIYPNVVPPSVSIWDAAAPEKSQIFMLVGVAILAPVIVIYTAYAYWIFRGKVDPDSGYH